MIPVMSREDARAFDAHVIDVCRVPSLVLMENAGRGAAGVIERELLASAARGKRVVIVCGTGNNGGDGFVVARRLVLRGAQVEAWLVGELTKLSRDAAVQMDAFAGIGGRLLPLGDEASRLPFATALADADVIIDALFGTGLDRPLEGALAAIVDLMNAAPSPKVALDLPSGMNADTGVAMGAAVVAACTVTFAHPKLGLLTPHGARLAGRVHVVDIGVPSALRTASSAELLEPEDVRAVVTPRPVDTHKYGAGHVAVFAGSAGKVGAALLSATACMRGGAGAVTVVTWSEAARALDARVVEIMTATIDADATMFACIDAALVGKRAVVIGPGFGTSANSRDVVDHLLVQWPGPVVFDADALTVHAGTIEAFEAAGGRAVLTPHAGELARLLGTTSAFVEADRFTAVRTAARRANAVVVLKGAHTLVASPDGRVVVNDTGSAVLATAGAGDVLAGLTGALLCTLDPFEAACAAVHLHGASGDAWQLAHADRGLLAHEIAEGLPGALSALLARG